MVYLLPNSITIVSPTVRDADDSFIRFGGGTVVERWIHHDQFGLMQQLDVVEPSG